MAWSYAMLQQGDVCTVYVSGEVDLSARHALTGALVGELDRPGTTALVVDLDAVEYLDSSGMTALVQAYNAAQDRGARFVLTRVNGGPRRALEIAGLLGVLTTT